MMYYISIKHAQPRSLAAVKSSESTLDRVILTAEVPTAKDKSTQRCFYLCKVFGTSW